MPKPENLIGQGFHTHPERINRKGRPKKYVTKLKAQGYKLSEINDTIYVMLSMNLDQVKKVLMDENTTILEKTIANAMVKSLKKGSLYSVETLLTRAFGKPKETTESTIDNKIEVIFVKGATIL